MAHYRVLLVCAAGMSSSLLEGKTIAAARQAGHELTIKAVSVGEVQLFRFDGIPVELVLIAPQVRYKKKSIEQMAGPFGIRVELIDPVTFGMVDGERVFEQIRQAIPKEDESHV